MDTEINAPSEPPVNASIELPAEFLRPHVQRLPTRLAKLGLALVCYAMSETWRALLVLLRRPPRGVATAIYYHKVPQEQCTAFARQMDHLLRWAQPIRADHCQQLPAGSRSVMVMFDDGWLSFVKNALPELEQRRIPVTLFAIADYLGCSAKSSADSRLVSAEELQRLDPQLVTLGSHTSTHAMLTTLSEDEALRELSESRSKLEQIMRVPVTLFSFPYSRHNERLVALCRVAGYQRVFTGVPGYALDDPQQFAIGRTRVDPTDWPIEFHLKMMGAYRWLPVAVSLKQKFRSSVRRAVVMFRALTGTPTAATP
jgi:peptidoglycan/xylan/chitin deacetylase (PgdA/CDA1 family)